MHEMKSMDTKMRDRCAALVRYAIEMPAKCFADHQVDPGGPVVIDLPGILN